jgi:hypothetical protein
MQVHAVILSVGYDTIISYWTVYYALSRVGKQYIPTARAGNNGNFNALPQALHKPIIIRKPS